MKQTNIVKHSLDILNNENDIKNMNKGRIFADCSTTAFVNTFLQDDVKRIQFVDYIYHKISSSVLLNLNEILIEKYDKPFMNNENFQLVYKGGNVMNMHGLIYIEELKKHIRRNRNENVLNQVIQDISNTIGNQVIVGGVNVTNIVEFLDGFKSNLKVSDVDFAAHIYADSYYNHYRAYEVVKVIIYQELVKIRDFFDGLLVKKPIQYDNEKCEESYSEEIIAEYVLIDNIVTCIKHKKEIDIKGVKTNPLSPDLLNDIGNNFNKLKNHDNISYLLKMHEYITYYLYINKINSLHLINFKTIIKDRIVKIITYKEKLVYESNFYNDIDLFKYNLCTELAGVKKDNSYYKITNNIDKEEITQIQRIANPTPNEITIEKRDDFFLNCTNTLDYFTNNGNNMKNVHYITYNNVINVPVFKGYLTINFDLMRIKFNVEASNFLIKSDGASQVKIPSEFLDISFTQYSDQSYDHIIKYDSVIFTNKNINKSLQVCAYNPKQICEDLEYILFMQSYLCPWLDFKYQKRLARLVYFYFIDIYYIYNSPQQKISPVIKENDRLDRLIVLENVMRIIKEIYQILKGNNNLNILLDYFKNNDICKQEYLDFLIDTFNEENSPKSIPFYLLININPIYNSYKILIVHILVFSILHYKSDYTYLEFMNYNRKQYNYVETTNPNFVVDNKKAFFGLLETCIINFQLFFAIGSNIKIDIPLVQLGGRMGEIHLSENSFGKQSFGKQSFGKELFGKELFNEKSFGKPSFDKQSFNKQSFNKQSFNKPSSGKPSFDKQSFGKRSFSSKGQNIIDKQLNVIMTDNANLTLIAPIILETKKDVTHMSINDYANLD